MTEGRIVFGTLAVLLCSQALHAGTIITFQQWRFTDPPANLNNIGADLPNPNNASASAPGAVHGDSLNGRSGVLILQTGDISFAVPNTLEPLGSKVVDIQLIYRLPDGGMLGNTRFGMSGFTGVFPPNFNTGLDEGWFQADFQFLRTTGCPASETLTVENPGLLAIDYAAIRTECTTPAVPEPSTLSLLSIGGVLFVLQLRRRMRRVSGNT